MIFWICQLLIGLTAITSPFALADPAKPSWSVYVADWGKTTDSAILIENMNEVDTIWMRMFMVLPNGHLNLKWTPNGPVVPIIKKLMANKKRQNFGPIIHNAIGSGFSQPFGLHILKSVDLWLPDLLLMKKKWKFNSLQIDIEELAPEDAIAYEAGVKKIAVFAIKNHLEFSIALHAQTETISKNVGARFQRWSELKLVPGKKIIMGLDYSWASGEPGPIAPTDWLQKIVAQALLFFKPQDLVVTFPLYGYHWRKGKPGESALPGEFSTQITQDKKWKRELIQNEPVYRKEDEVISFEDTESILQKKDALEKLGIQSFAFWKVGGELSKLYH